MTPAEKEDLLWLILFVAVVGLVLIITVMLLMTVWRRSIGRIKGDANSTQNKDMPDAWKASGERLVAQMSPFPKADSDDGVSGHDYGDASKDRDDRDQDDDDDGSGDFDGPGSPVI